VVDLDLEKFFDTVNHDLLIKMVRETVSEEAIITLIKEVLEKRGDGGRTGQPERAGDAAGREPIAVVEQHIPGEV
jgi:hypothetical protein